MASLAQFSSAHLLQLVTVAVNSSIPCMHNTTTTLSDDDILYTGIYSYFYDGLAAEMHADIYPVQIV